jgi:DNA-binding IscR family transcriptional regulator
MVTSTRTRIDARRNQQHILELIRTHPTGRITYDTLAARVDIDRRTVITIVCYLRTRGAIEVEPGRGHCPNRYQLAG